MKYIEVNKQFVACSKYGCYEFIERELITFKEFHNICIKYGFNEHNLILFHGNFSVIEKPKNKTSWFFGCRF